MPFSIDIEGFDILPNGDFLVADLDTIREYSRDFSTFSDYVVTLGGGWQGVAIHNGEAFVVGAQELGGFDTGTKTQNFYYSSMTDNAELCVRSDVVIGLNYQFHDNADNLANGTTDFVELLTGGGVFLSKAFLPDPFWTAGGGIAFGPNGDLLVPSNELNAAGDRVIGTHLVRFDSSFASLGVVDLANWREASGIAVSPTVPEPGTCALFVAGAAAGLFLRRRKSQVLKLGESRPSPA